MVNMSIVKTGEYIPIGHGVAMELVLKPKKKFNQIGKGYICLKESSFHTPASSYLFKKDNENSSPEILLSLEEDICIEKVKERLYDITFFNDRTRWGNYIKGYRFSSLLDCDRYCERRAKFEE